MEMSCGHINKAGRAMMNDDLVCYFVNLYNTLTNFWVLTWQHVLQSSIYHVLNLIVKISMVFYFYWLVYSVMTSQMLM